MNNIAFGATRKLLEPQFSPQENGSDSDSESGSSESSGLETAFRWLFKWGDQKKRMDRDQLWHHLRTSAPVRWGEPRLWEEKEKESEKRKEEEPWRIVALLYKNLLSKWHHTARISRKIILIYFDRLWSISIAPLLAWEALDKRVIWWRTGYKREFSADFGQEKEGQKGQEVQKEQKGREEGKEKEGAHQQWS